LTLGKKGNSEQGNETLCHGPRKSRKKRSAKGADKPTLKMWFNMGGGEGVRYNKKRRESNRREKEGISMKN